MKKVLIFLQSLFFIIQIGHTQNQFSDPILRKIYDLQDQRKSSELVKYFQNTNPVYRANAALAFASTQDSLGLSGLIELLKDANPQVRQASAYAIGQIGKASAENAIIQTLDNETDTKVKLYLLESLGKCNGAKALSYLCQSNYTNDSLNLGVMRGLYRAGLKNQRSEEATKKVISLLKSDYPSAKEMAGFYLARFANSLNISPFQEDLLNVLRFSIYLLPTLKINAATALGYINSPEITEALKNTVNSKENYLIRYSALRALMRQKNVKPFIKEVLSTQKNKHLALAASQYLIENVDKEDQDWLKQLLYTKARLRLANYWQVRINLMQALAIIDSSSNTYEKMKGLYQQANTIYEKAAWLRAMSRQVENYDWIAQEFEKTKDKVLKVATLEALNSIRTNPKFTEIKNLAKAQAKFGEIYQQAVESEDVGLIYTVSEILLNEKLGYKSYYADYQFIRNSLNKIQMPRDVEAYIELQKVLAYFEGKPAPSSYPQSPLKPMDWELIKSIKTNQKVLIRTSEGSVILKLLVNEAPASVGTFVKLLKEGFYNKKSFHRIVSNFVVQGGCPRGDGFGGLDYTIRSEFAPLYYQSGSVGLASAGKDTESCQFFITHLPTPHLDGRYTIFAEVAEGMEVVHQLMIGGKIEEVKLID